MTSTPVVWIIVPAYNIDAVIVRTPRSFGEQTERALEFIVSDNAGPTRGGCAPAKC